MNLPDLIENKSSPCRKRIKHQHGDFEFEKMNQDPTEDESNKDLFYMCRCLEMDD